MVCDRLPAALSLADTPVFFLAAGKARDRSWRQRPVIDVLHVPADRAQTIIARRAGFD
jgi:hypothetical protein